MLCSDIRHIPYLDIGEKITVLNPGSLSYPRQKGRRASYIIMEIHEDNSVEYELHYI